jgi:hypothetical protein
MPKITGEYFGYNFNIQQVWGFLYIEYYDYCEQVAAMTDWAAITPNMSNATWPQIYVNE